MNDRLMRTLLSPPSASDAPGRVFGVVIGIVTDNQDPENMHRVKLRFPWLNNDHESHWARVVAPMAGNKRGAYFLPEVDDEALVAFEHGSIEHPYVVGLLWNGKDAAPESNSGDNDNRSITSRSGHVIRLCDKQGDESIEVIDQTGNNRVVIRSSGNTIAIEAQGDISIKSSTGKVKIEGIGVEIKSSAGVTVQAQTTLDAQAAGPVTIKGAMVRVN